MTVAHESGRDAAFDELEERPEVPDDIEEDDGDGDEAELVPGDDLEGLVERAETAGQHDHAVGQLGHAGFAFVHARHHLQPGEPEMGDLRGDELLGHHPDDVATCNECRVGDGAHQTDVAPAVHECVSLGGQRPSQRLRRFDVTGIAPRTRTTEHTQRSHRSIVAAIRHGAGPDVTVAAQMAASCTDR